MLGAASPIGCLSPVPASGSQDVGHEGPFARPELHQAEFFRRAPLLPAGDAPDSDHLAECLSKSSKVVGFGAVLKHDQQKRKLVSYVLVQRYTTIQLQQQYCSKVLSIDARTHCIYRYRTSFRCTPRQKVGAPVELTEFQIPRPPTRFIYHLLHILTITGDHS